jgi:DNA-directed RNA polymerase specialized sigma24 family protein
VAHHVRHESTEALAVRYGATQGAIKQRLRRIRRKLADSLAQEGFALNDCRK